MSNEENKRRINDACASLYRDEYDLIRNRAHERTIAGSIFAHFREVFQSEGWNVDIEYNREGDEGDPKRDDMGNMIPDIVVHTRGVPEGPNLLALELKGYWNKDDRSIDEEKLRRIRSKYGYQYLYRLELSADNWELIEVDPVVE